MPNQADTATPEGAALLNQRIEANLYAARTGLPGNVYETVNAFNHTEERPNHHAAASGHAPFNRGSGRCVEGNQGRTIGWHLSILSRGTMTILWEMTAWPDEKCGCYTYADQKDAWARTFLTDGKPKQWPTRPTVVAGVEPRRKKPWPIPPIGHIALASIVLQPHAVAVLGQFLTQFGELLDVEYAGGLVYLYNVTTLVSCVDEEQSRKDPTGSVIIRPAFRENAIPTGPVIFKDPLTATTRLYATPAARQIIMPLLQQNCLTGLTFYEAGSK